MEVYIFGDQTVDCRLFLRQIYQRKGLLLTTFLDHAGNALREEISALPNVRHGGSIPSFNNVLELVDRSSNARSRHPAVDSAFVCLAQLAHFIAHHEEFSKGYPRSTSPSHPKIRLLGLCTGLLAASAIASVDSLIALLPVAVETVRIAFRTGAHVADVAERLDVFTEADESWSTVFAVSDVGSAEKALDTFHEEYRIPSSNRLHITVVASNTITITGPPSMQRRLLEHCEPLRKVHHLKVPIHGPYHTPHLHSHQDITNILRPSTCNAFGSLGTHLALTSSVTGEPLVAKSSIDLIRNALEEILLERANWNLVVAQLVADAPTLEGCSVISVGPTNLANSVLAALKDANVSHSSTEGETQAVSQEIAIPPIIAKTTSSSIAIVGMAGRFPNAADHELLWDLLEKGLDVHREIPKNRFDVKTHYDPSSKIKNTTHTPYGCFIEDPGLFDARFFNMSPREAAQTDPMQRLMLSTAYEAMEMAGIVPGRTPSTKAERIGTFYGQTSDDWREINAAQNIDTYFISGGVRAFGAGRINYHFKFSGPSFIIDTACSSSLAAIQLACTSLQAGECDTAFTGGANVLTNPDIFSGLSRGHFLSKTGSCKTFDNDADGYCRGDGVATVILKRLDDAIADRDPILGVIRGTATNHSAEAVSITHPHVGAQEFLFSKILQDSGVDAHEISYVEMHGTGTQAGDGVEMESVSNVFAPRSRQRSAQEPLYLGAIKSNIGHGESVSGVSSLIKLLMMFQKDFIPPHCGIKGVLNKNFPTDLAKRNINIPLAGTAFPRPKDGVRRVFLNNFSAAGGNTGLLLEDGPSHPNHSEIIDPRPVSIVTVSAKSLASFKSNVDRLASFVDKNNNVDLPSLSYTTTSRRMHYTYRAAIPAASVANVTSALRTLRGSPPSPVAVNAPRIGFVFTGQGSQYLGIAIQFYQTSRTFRTDLELFDDLAKSQGFVSFLGLVDGSAGSLSSLSAVTIQLGLVGIQIALVRLWSSWGIKPACVIGHSLGEYAALNTAGVLSIADTIYLVGERARQMESQCSSGSHAMLAVRGNTTLVQNAIRGTAVEIACINGPENFVLSGLVADIDHLVPVFKAQDFRCKKLNVPYAFHSSQMDCILDSFEQSAGAATFHLPKVPVISPLRGEIISDDEIFGPKYLAQHCRQPVDFLGGLSAASASGAIDKKTLWIEIGPNPVCSEMIKASLDSSIITLPSLRSNEDPWKTVAGSLSSLYSAGVTIDWSAYHKEYEVSTSVLNLPSYSFDDKVYWLDYTNDWTLTKGDVPVTAAVPEKPRLSTTSVQKVLEESTQGSEAKILAESDFLDPLLHKVVSGHLVNGAGLVPSSLWADMALTVAEYGHKLLQLDSSDLMMNIANMSNPASCIVKSITKAESQKVQIQALISLPHQQATVTISSSAKEGGAPTVHAQCIVKYESRSAWLSETQRHAFLLQSRMEMLWKKMESGEAHRILRGVAYKLFAGTVLYDDKFRGMKEVILDSAQSEATSVISFQAGRSDGDFHTSPYFIDSVAHLSGFIMNATNSGIEDSAFISHGWESMRFARPLDSAKEYYAHVKMQPCGKNVMAGDVHVFEGDDIVGKVGGLKFQRIPRRLLNTMLPSAKSNPAQERRAAPIAPAIKKTVTPVKTSAKPMKRVRLTEKALTRATSSTSELTVKALTIMAAEIGVDASELADNIPFADLGVDSLMSLSIAGRFREKLDLEIDASLFADYPTIGDIKTFLAKHKGDAKPETTPELSDDTSTSSETNSEAEPSSTSSQEQGPPSADDKSDVIRDLRSIIAEEMGMDIEEIADTTDLSTMGLDSLMSLTIIGALREKTSLEISPSLFIDNCSIEDIRTNLGLHTPISPSNEPVPPNQIDEIVLPSVTKREPAATSVLLQGNPRTATQNLFFFPDGSGSATSYVSIPPLRSQDLCVYGLNCPFMKDPASYTIGLPAVSRLYIKELLRRQPQGPYILGGWSAGGVVALEVMRQLQAMHRANPGKNYRVSQLLLLDAPNPIALAPLPSRLHIFFNEIGLLGTGNPAETPSWLLPHFQASINNLCAYDPEIIPIDPAEMPKVLLLWAKDGVCKSPEDPRPEPQDDDPNSMKWLLENRTDFGTNGWEKLLGGGNCDTAVVEANHFTMMREPMVSEMAEIIRGFLFP